MAECVHVIQTVSKNDRINLRMDLKLSKKDIVKRSDVRSGKKNKFVWTRNKIIAASVIGAGFSALVIFAVMVFVFDLGPVAVIKSSEEDARVVGTCAGYEVRYEELRYVTLIHKAELDEEYGTYDSLSAEKKAEYDGELEERVTKSLRSNYTILSLCDKYDIDTDTRESKKYVKNAIEEFVDEVGGKDEYKKWLEKNDLTDEFVRLMYKVDYLESVLLSELTKSGEEIKYSTANLDDFVKFIIEDESYVKTIHAYYPKEHEYLDTSSMKDRALAALEKIQSAKNDTERHSYMLSAIGQAPFVPGYSVTGSDYYFTYGQMHEDYEAEAFSLDEYGVSSVIELEEGYYIIMRVPKVRDEVAPRAYELIDHYRYAVLKQMCDAQREEISFVGNDYFKTIKLNEIK